MRLGFYFLKIIGILYWLLIRILCQTGIAAKWVYLNALGLQSH